MGIRRNMISNLLLTSSAVVFPLITFPYITRTLSNTSIGKYFFIDALTQYFIIVSAVGIPYYGIREIAKVKDAAQARSKLVMELLCIQMALAVCCSLVFLGLHYVIPTLRNDTGLVKIACIGILSTSFLMEWFYQGIEHFTYITGRSLILKTLSVISIFLFVRHADDYLLYYLLITLLVFANAALNFANYLRNYHVPYIGSMNIRQHIKPLAILFSINVSVSIYAVLDTIILGLLTNPASVSYYSVPLKLVKIFWTVVNGAGVVLIPRVASYFVNNDSGGIQSVMQKSMNIVFLLTIPFCFFCLMFPAEILSVIAGHKYAQAATALRILSVVPFIIAVCNVCGTQYLMPIGKEKSILHATLLGLVVSLGLNFLLIPRLNFTGAAIACVAAESAVCLYILVAATKSTKLLIDYSLLTHIVIALLLTVISKYFLGMYLKGLRLIISAFAVYCTGFIFLQLLYFKNNFVFSLTNYKSLKGS
jgi:O-antigen/teichoic acid export membrane protein